MEGKGRNNRKSQDWVILGRINVVKSKNFISLSFIPNIPFLQLPIAPISLSLFSVSTSIGASSV
jgi:hypothetical protein